MQSISKRITCKVKANLEILSTFCDLFKNVNYRMISTIKKTNLKDIIQNFSFLVKNLYLLYENYTISAINSACYHVTFW